MSSTVKSPGTKASGKTERLQKVMAHAGVASRRHAETLILEGSVTVNGKVVTELGTKVDPLNDKIKVNGRMLLTDVEPIYLAFYKPKGVISALKDPEGRPCISDYTKHLREKVNPIGRLDFNSEGLLLLTNDGELANKISKNKKITKIYLLKIKGHPPKDQLDSLKKGFFTPNGVLRFSNYEVTSKLRNKSWLKLEVSQGSQLDIKELFNRKGLLVDRIVRSAIGSIELKDLEPGEYNFLKKSDFLRLISE